MAPPFQESDHSDNDSISLHSTEPSEEEEGYDVEKILAEEADDEGEPQFLIKWQGYPLHRSTWEPAENLNSAEILAEWRQTKLQIKNGALKGFDMAVYDEACLKDEEEREERARRRAAKRKRLGFRRERTRSVSGGSASDVAMRDAGERPHGGDPPANRRKRPVDSPTKKKGMAQTVKKSLDRPTVVASSSEESSDDGAEDNGSTSEDLLMEETSRKSKAPIRGRSPAKQKTSSASGARSNNTGSTVAKKDGKATKKLTPAQAIIEMQKKKSASSIDTKNTHRPSAPATGASRKSAPTSGSQDVQSRKQTHARDSGDSRSPQRPLKRPSVSTNSVANAFMNFGNAEPSRRQRTRTGEDPREQRFKNLSEQHRFHKFGEKEAAPDPSMLGTYNPATGRMELPPSAVASTTAIAASSVARNSPPKQPSEPARPGASAPPPSTTSHDTRNAQMPTRVGRPTGQAPAGSIPSVFGRRDAPAPESQRSISPPPPPNDHSYPAFPSYNANPEKERTKTCWRWRNGVCNRHPNDCWFAHFFITCDLWRQGLCPNDEKRCDHEHREVENDTPTAPQPIPPRQAPTQMSVYEARKIFKQKDITCRFWKDGHCNKTEDKCKFAHRDTGVYAGRPGSNVILQNPPNFGPPPVPDQMAGVAAQSPLRTPSAMSPGGRAQIAPMIVDDQSRRDVVMSPGQMSPASEQPLSSFQQSHGPAAFSHDIVLSVNCGGIEYEVKAKLACATQRDESLLGERLGSQARLQMQKMINVSDLQHYFGNALQESAQLPCGDIKPEASNDNLVGQLAEMCKAHVSCGVVMSSEFALLVFPTGTEEFKVLGQSSQGRNSKAALKFKMLSVLANEARQEEGQRLVPSVPVNATSAPAEAISALLDVDVDHLLTIREGQKETRAFIMMPPSHTEEVKLLAKAFEGQQLKVRTSLDPGAWDDLLKVRHSSTLIVLHPEVPLWSIRGLGGILYQLSWRVFTVGLNPPLAALEKRAPKFECQRLFPMGDVVFITDDVFLDYPEKAIQVVHNINTMNHNKPPGALRCKVAARPGVRTWLMNLAIERTKDRPHSLWRTLFEVISDLAPSDLEDEYYPGNPSEDADLVSIAPESLPTFQELERIDPVRALDYAVSWFAGWCYMNASQYRRFSVCHAPQLVAGQGLGAPVNADPRGWANEYGYLVVETPERWLQSQVDRKQRK